MLLFPVAFWGAPDMFGRTAPSAADRGEFFLFYSYAHISGGAVLAALVAGDAALRFERQPPEEAARKVLRVLRGIFEPKGVRVPAPLQVTGDSGAYFAEDMLHPTLGPHALLPRQAVAVLDVHRGHMLHCCVRKERAGMPLSHRELAVVHACYDLFATGCSRVTCRW